MKVTLNNFEIQEAVQCYISNILGSDLKVTEISVVQGREQGGSNTSRIELELVKADTTVKCSKVPANACIEISPVDVPVLPEPIEKTIEEVQEEFRFRRAEAQHRYAGCRQHRPRLRHDLRQ